MYGDVGFYGRNQGQSGHEADTAECPLLTQSGHRFLVESLIIPLRYKLRLAG